MWQTTKKKKGNNIKFRIGWDEDRIGPRAHGNFKGNGNVLFLKLNHVYKYQCTIIIYISQQSINICDSIFHKNNKMK